MRNEHLMCQRLSIQIYMHMLMKFSSINKHRIIRLNTWLWNTISMELEGWPTNNISAAILQKSKTVIFQREEICNYPESCFITSLLIIFQVATTLYHSLNYKIHCKTIGGRFYVSYVSTAEGFSLFLSHSPTFCLFISLSPSPRRENYSWIKHMEINASQRVGCI